MGWSITVGAIALIFLNLDVIAKAKVGSMEFEMREVKSRVDSLFDMQIEQSVVLVAAAQLNYINRAINEWKDEQYPFNYPNLIKRLGELANGNTELNAKVKNQLKFMAERASGTLVPITDKDPKLKGTLQAIVQLGRSVTDQTTPVEIANPLMTIANELRVVSPDNPLDAKYDG